MKIFVIQHSKTGPVCRTYEGMGPATVQVLVIATGDAFDIVDEPTYLAALPKSSFGKS